MDSELTRMEEMTSTFLDYASMERQALNLKKQTINIADLVTSAINDCQTLAEHKNITVELNTERNRIIQSRLPLVLSSVNKLN